MKTLNLIAAVGLTLAAVSASASKDRGGGSVVLCYSGAQVAKMESYDFAKGRSQIYNLSIPRSTRPYMDQVAERVARLRRLDPLMASTIEQLAKGFSPDTIANGGGDVGLVPNLQLDNDSALDWQPGEDYARRNNCSEVKVVRLAQFLAQQARGYFSFQLVRELWSAADEETKAAIVQHETIYRMAKKAFGDETSESTQFFNGLISSEQFNSYDMIGYYRMLAKLKWIQSADYCRTRSIREACEDVKFTPVSSTPFNEFEFITNSSLAINLTKENRLKNVLGTIRGAARPKVFGQEVEVGHWGSRSADGSFSGETLKSATISLAMQSFKIYANKDVNGYPQRVRYDAEKGTVCTVVEGSELKTDLGILRPAQETSAVCFDKTGRIVSFDQRDMSATYYSRQFARPYKIWKLGIDSTGRLTGGSIRFCSKEEGDRFVVDGQTIRSNKGETRLNGVYKILEKNGSYSLEKDTYYKCGREMYL